MKRIGQAGGGRGSDALTGTPETPTGTAPGPTGARDLLGAAIRAKHRVFALHRGDLVLFCPHALAQRHEGIYVLAFLLKADALLVAERFSSPLRWRWLSVEELTGIVTAPGGWYAGPTAAQPPLAGGRMDIEREAPDTGTGRGRY